tara:strand:- start:1154 stop:1360 length:207 start_codon:yes stop_codon:yes gene_type:complete
MALTCEFPFDRLGSSFANLNEDWKMASASKITEFRRKRKESKAGKKRKAKNRNQGTTRSEKELFGDKE